MPALRTHLVKIGNSHGIRIPKAILQQIHLIDEIEIEVKRDYLIIKAAENQRTGWAEAFKLAATEGESPEDVEWEKASLTNDKGNWTWK